MYVDNPRRLMGGLAAVVLVLFAVWFVALRPASSPAGPPPVPPAVKAVLTATGAAPRVMVTTTHSAGAPAAGTPTASGQPAVSEQVIDHAAGADATFVNGQLTALQTPSQSYNLTSAHCYDMQSVSGQTPAPQASNPALALIPTGVANIVYSYPSPGVIDWRMVPVVAVAPDRVPSGVVITDPVTHRVLSATISGSSAQPQHVTVGYAPTLTVAPPHKICPA